MSRFVDMIKLASMLEHNSIPNLTLVVNVGEKVEPEDYGITKLKRGVSVYIAKVYYASFDKLTLRKKVSDIGNKPLIDRMDKTHFINGECYIAIDDGEYKTIGNRFLVEANGRLSPITGSKCRFFFTKWTNVGSVKEPVFSATGVETSLKINCMNPEDKPFFLETWNKKFFVQPSDRAKGQYMGVEIPNPELIKPPEKSSFSVYEPSSAPLGELGVVKANERYGGMIAPEKPKDVVETKRNNLADAIAPKPKPKTNTRTSITAHNRVIDINRSKFRKAFEELEAKYNDLAARQEAIESYAVANISSEPPKVLCNGEYIYDWCEYYIDKLSQTLSKYWLSKPSDNMGYSGNQLFKFVLEELLPEDDFRTLWDMCCYTADIVECWHKDTLNGIYSVIEPYRIKILFRLLEKILGVSCDLYYVNLDCEACGYTVFDFIQCSPYRIGLITNIALKDLDKLAVIAGHFGKKSSNLDRSIAYYHWHFTDSVEMNGSTIMEEQDARLLKPGYYITKGEYLRLSGYSFSNNKGIYFDDNVRVDIEHYLDCPVSNMYISQSNWQNDPSNSARLYYPTMTLNGFDEYLTSNIGVRLILDKTYVSDFSIYKKEIGIYHKLYSFNSTLPEIDVDNYIKKFELSQGANFKLEERQKDAIRNCFIPENSVYTTTGGAGSGKTTLISCILYIYTVALQYSEEDIIMVAPTGKAATQITEKTGFAAKTIHSQFKIGLPYDINDFTGKVVIIDESSMINLDLMYTTLNRIPDNVRIIFSGDINQLEPIGFGQPFADSLNYTPIVTLNVMKRAESGSTINRNAKRLSEGYEELDTGDDFKIINTADYLTVIRNRIDNLLASGCTLKDIQVISPVSTDKYAWGTQKLNEYLQGVYNRANNANTIKYKHFTNFTLYKVGDPVIHTENNYDKPHYVWDDNMLYESGQGIRNGEIGYIRKIWTGEELSKYIADEQAQLAVEVGRHNAMFVEVVYDTAGDIYSLFYSCRTTDRDSTPKPGIDGYEVIGGTLSSIQLAYAITVHKMQGSQAKHIIVLWYIVKRPRFLNRNMLYTACTRAQKTVTLIGDLAAIRKAREYVSYDFRYSYIKKYFQLHSEN